MSAQKIQLELVSVISHLHIVMTTRIDIDLYTNRKGYTAGARPTNGFQDLVWSYSTELINILLSE